MADRRWESVLLTIGVVALSPHINRPFLWLACLVG